MTKRFYPAVLERGAKDVYAVWFPDFAGCVAAAKTQEEAMAKAWDALSRAVLERFERGQPLPEPSQFERIAIPKGSKPIGMVAIGVEPPDASERVNVYLPKSLIARVDTRAAELGMSRSSFFGLALSQSLAVPGLVAIPAPRRAPSATRKRRRVKA